MEVCDPGVGLWAAEMANHLKENDAGLELLCVLHMRSRRPNGLPIFENGILRY